MEAACEELLAGGDTDVFLVAVAKCIQDAPTPSGSAEDAAGILLQDNFKSILSQLGWELLGLFLPHIQPTDQQSHLWALVREITSVCSPKEMVLALLEQMDVLSMDKPLAVFKLLVTLREVMSRLPSSAVAIVNSTLRSTFRLLKSLLASAISMETEDKERQERRKRRRAGRGNASSKDAGTKKEEGSSSVADSMESDNESDDDDDDDQGVGDAVSSLSAAEAVEFTLDFVRPHSEEVHREYVSNGGGEWRWTQRQEECIAILLLMLECPLTQRKHSASKLSRDIMSCLVKCHCGCMRLFAWRTPQGQHHHGDDSLEEADEEHLTLSPLGISSFAYFLFSERLELDYLPLVYSTSFLFHTVLSHCKPLLERQNAAVQKRGLKLLEALLALVPRHTLPSHLLDTAVYLELIQVLVHLMSLSDTRSIRQVSVRTFQSLLTKFEERGRHRLYLKLFHHLDHSGVKGLLTHAVKDEVDSALKAGSGREASLFLGSSLLPLLELSMSADTSMKLYDELDRFMSGLNFLRYLLIRDKKDVNQTGVWDMLGGLEKHFISPLRQLLLDSRAYCRGDLQRLKEEMKEAKSAEGGGARVEMTVEVPRAGNLPEPTPEDEVKMIHVAQQHMDMMESVLVRVEELMNI